MSGLFARSGGRADEAAWYHALICFMLIVSGSFLVSFPWSVRKNTLSFINDIPLGFSP